MAIDFNDPVQRAAALEHQKHVVRIRNEAKRAVAAEERGPVDPPAAITLRDLLVEPDDPTVWRIKDCQPAESRVILAAQFKTGKTTVVANVIRSLRDGDPFLGKYLVAPVEGTIALLDFEMSRSQLQRWYRDQQIVRDDRVVVFPMRGRAASFNLADADVRTAWAARFRALGVRFVIIDCLRPILDALGLDEHHEVGAFLVPLDMLLVDAGIPDCLVVHHMGHTNERSRGDSRLRDWPDVEWRLMRKDEDPASARFFTAFGRDVDVTEQELGYDRATRRLTVIGGSRRDAKVEEALVAVLAFVGVAETPPTRNAILKGLKESDHGQPSVKAAIKLGVQRGCIVTTKGKNNAQLHSIVTEASTTRRAYSEM
jgi:hypothetical protein